MEKYSQNKRSDDDRLYYLGLFHMKKSLDPGAVLASAILLLKK
jgi:hypothetical protein